MDPQQHCLQQISSTGSSIYYACLFLTEQQRLRLAPLITLSWRIERIPRFTEENEVVLNQLNWWQNEIKQLSSGNASHPITRAIATNKKSLTLEAFEEYCLHFYQMQQDCQIDDAKAFLNHALKHRGQLLQVAAKSLQLPKFSPSQLENISQLLSWLDIIDGFHRDLDKGLMYLPLENLIRAKVTVDDLNEKQASANKTTLFWQDCYNIINQHYQQFWITSDRENPLLLSISIYSGLRLEAFKKSLQKSKNETNNCYNQRPINGTLRKLWLSWIIRSRWLSEKTIPRIYTHD